jgi:hypothetical protein
MNCYFCQGKLERVENEELCRAHILRVHHIIGGIMAYVIVPFHEQEFQVVWYLDEKVLRIIPPIDRTTNAWAAYRAWAVPEGFQTITPDNILSKLPLLLNFS